MMQAEPLLTWRDVVWELATFGAEFLAAGAVGFRYSSLRGERVESDRPFYEDAASHAAWLGMTGVVVTLLMFAVSLPGVAARQHVSVGALVMSDVATLLNLVFLVIALLGFALAIARKPIGWMLAAVGVIGGALRTALLGQWSHLVNPIHSLAAGLWLGTLFVLVVAGLRAVVRHETAHARRAAIVADMVNNFSPLALAMGGVVVVFGLITGWRHLHVLSNLWSTPYGYALMVKLALVATVFALGAWNWRRQRPTLGTDEAALSIQRSATSELVVAVFVLIATAVVVSLPSPKG
ncbi:MAG TPA: CopD family protein [Gemmatimonadaceae bacterium]|jgi:copper transport protein